MTQIEDLQFLLLTHSLAKHDDEPLTTDVTPSDPVGQFFEKAAFVAAGGPENWSDSLAKSAIARTEERVTANGDVWRYSYGSNSQLISARVVNGDGGELRKGAEESDVNLVKAASPHHVRYERAILDGSEWVLGWNDRGENCYASPLEDHERMYKSAEEALEI